MWWNFIFGGEEMSEKTRVTVLLENTSRDGRLVCEHGLSLYIEASNRKILFDMGQSDAFAKNAEALGIDLSEVDVAILSHGHYDHAGGIKTFLEINKKALIYMNKRAFGRHLNADGRYIGIAPELAKSDRIVYVDDFLEIDCELGLYSCNGNEKIHPTESRGLEIEENGVRRPDDFLHEQYLIIQEGDKRILVSGCSHKGILNIVEWFKPDALIGGFHFSRISDRERLCSYAHALTEYPTRYFTGHCTGVEQFGALKEIMADSLEYIYTGKRFEI